MSDIQIKNRKATHEYSIYETFEAGLVLTGTEIKSIRKAQVNLSEGWVDIDAQGEAILREVHITPYDHGNIFNHDPKRPRKLLLKRKELLRLEEATSQKGYTIVALKMYFKKRFVKVLIGVAKGKKHYDKREAEKTKDANLEIRRALKG